MILILAFILVIIYFWIQHKGIEYILLHYRWIFVVLFLMPISLIYDVYFYARNWLIFNMKSAPNKHDAKVKVIQKQIENWIIKGRSSKLCTGRPGWMATSLKEGKYKKTFTNIKIDLLDVLEVNVEKRIVHVEPSVTMGQITATLIPLGWTLPIVPELDDLTVGGLIMGVGIESSSHKYGLMQHVVESLEIVTADAHVLKCSQTENTDLFYALPWSHGTLGFLISVKLKIIPAKKYVRLEYHPVYSLQELVSKFKEASHESHDFVEGLMYSKNEAVIMTGTMTDDAEPHLINALGCYYKPWFFKYVQSFLQSGPSHGYIPLRQYYHRHTKSIFWQLQDIIPFGNNIFFRYIFGWMVPPKISFLKLTQGETIKRMYEKYQIIQDMLIPFKYMQESLEFFHDKLMLYPLWLCPFRLPNNPGFLNSFQEDLFVDIGAYGAPKIKNYNSYDTVRSLEQFVLERKGFQMLYADSLLSWEEFHQMFDHTLYNNIRKELNCDSAFPQVYDKVSAKNRY